METHEVILEIPLEHERNLFGGLDCHVKKIEQTLRISVILRDGAVKLVGSKSAVEQAKNVFWEASYTFGAWEYDYGAECRLCSSTIEGTFGCVIGRD